MAFKNTVETVGDEALANSIIDKSITEIHDDIIMTTGRGIFQGCTALTNVNFKSVTTIEEDAFSGCNSLKKAEFHSKVDYIEANAFSNSGLEALILRGELGSLASNAFDNCPIKAGTGYIYVPAAQVDSYKAHGTWNAFESQIRAIEDYPEIVDPYSWGVVLKTIADGTYKNAYKVGDTVPLDLGSEGIINMQIVAFDTDDLADGSGKAPITWVAKEVLPTQVRFNPQSVRNSDGTYQEGTGAIGGWEKSELRAYLKNTIKPMIPEYVRNAIKEVSKTQRYRTVTNGDSSQTTTDDVWVLSDGDTINYNATYSWFKTTENRIKCVVGSTSASGYWRRDTAMGSDYGYMFNSKGESQYLYAQYTSGVCLCFCT